MLILDGNVNEACANGRKITTLQFLLSENSSSYGRRCFMGKRYLKP